MEIYEFTENDMTKTARRSAGIGFIFGVLFSCLIFGSLIFLGSVN